MFLTNLRTTTPVQPILLQKLFTSLLNIVHLLIDQRRVLITILIYIFTLHGNWTGTSTGKHSFMWNVRDRSRVPLFLKGVFPKCFAEPAELSDKNICHYSQRAQNCHTVTSCVRDQDSTQCQQDTRRDRIFKLSPIHASVIFKFPEFTESSESSPLLKLHCTIPVPYTTRSRSRAVLISYQCHGWTPYGIPITNLHPETVLFAQARHLPP